MSQCKQCSGIKTTQLYLEIVGFLEIFLFIPKFYTKNVPSMQKTFNHELCKPN